VALTVARRYTLMEVSPASAGFYARAHQDYGSE
jgi:hypothetical protein